MLLTSAVGFPSESVDPSHLVSGAVEVLRRAAIVNEHSSVKLNVSARASSAFIRHLESLVKLESSTRNGVGKVYRAVTLTEHFSFGEALVFLETQLADWPEALEAASLSITAYQFRWRGSPPGSTGYLRLWNSRSRGRRGARKTRFSRVAALVCRGESLDDPSFLDALRSTSEATELDFDEGRFSTQHDPSGGPSPQERFAIEVCFQEALARTARWIRRFGLAWKGRPGLMTYRDAVEGRFRLWAEGPRIRLNGPIKRLMAAEFPGFVRQRGRGLCFLKHVTGQWGLHLAFDNDRLGTIGKGFTVMLGIEGTSGPPGGLVWRDSLFRLFDADALQPCWTYGTARDLAATLRGVAALLREVLPAFEASCRLYLDPLPNPDALPSSIRKRGPITARQGWPEALEVARAWSSSATLIRLTSTRYLDARDLLGPAVGPDGRLRIHGLWSYRFRSSHHPEETLIVEVPSVGAVRSSRFAAPEPEDVPLGDDWLDSDQVLAIAETIGGREARERAVRVLGLRCDLKTDRSPFGIDPRVEPLPGHASEPIATEPWWEVLYALDERDRRRKYSVVIDAVSGGQLQVPART